MPILSGVGAGDGLEWFKAIPGLTDYYYTAYAYVYGEGDPNPEIPEVQAEYESTFGGKLDGSMGSLVMPPFRFWPTRSKELVRPMERPCRRPSSQPTWKPSWAK